MEENNGSSVIKKRLIAAAVAVGTVLGVAGVAGALTGQADDTTDSSTTSAQVDDDSSDIDADGAEANESGETDDEREGDHDGDRMADETPLEGMPGGGRHGDGDRKGGSDETPVTGDLATKLTAAAEEAVAGGTVDRIESEGNGYEAHMTSADGQEVEVHFDADLAVVDIEQGH